jgi:type IV pilus assembly protein PilQ
MRCLLRLEGRERSFYRSGVAVILGLGLAAGLYGCSATSKKEEPQILPPVAEPSKPQIKEATLTDQGFRVEELQLKEEFAQTTIRIRFSAPVTQYRHFVLAQPARIVLDVFGDARKLSDAQGFRAETHWVSALKINSAEGLLRLTIEIAAATAPSYSVDAENQGLKIVLGSPNPDATAKRELSLIEGGQRTDLRAPQAKAPASDSKTSSGAVDKTAEKKYTGQRISLDFKDADIKNVFRLLAEISNLNIVVTPDVQRRVTVRLVDVPWDQAMDLLIDTNGLAKEQIDNVVRISTAATLRAEKDSLLAAKKAQDSVEPLETAYFNVNYAKASEVVSKVLDKMKPTLSPRGSIVPDDRSNMIVIRDIRRGVEDAINIISRLDVRTPQVLIESNLIETTPTFARALGFQLGFTTPWNDQSLSNLTPFGTTGLGTTPTTIGQQATSLPGLFPGGGNITSNFPAGEPFGALGGTISIIQNRLGIFRNLSATLTAAEQEGQIKIISRPSVVTLNNVESTIKSTRVLRVQLPSSGTSTVVGGAGGQQTLAVQDIEVGIILQVTPQVSSDGFVLLKIDVESSTLGTRSSGAAIPDELSRHAIANVLVRDGETIVIGGIMKDTRQESEGGIPYLKDIPVLGWLFKNIRWQKDFEELMVFITPRIVAGGSENLPSAEQLWRQQLKKTDGG